ncbi:MAG: hypothetical protein ACXVNM_11550 [Bacteroidia bacterium]
MKKCLLYFLAFVFIIQLTSCAIHRKFPFICFKKECVLGQLGYYSARESFKRAKINGKVRKHKKEIKRNLRLSRKGKKPPYDLEKEKKQSDSLTYARGFSGVCKELKIVFVSTNKDTVIAHYAFDEKDLSEDEKKVIKDLVGKNGAALFNEVIIINCHKRSILSEYEAFWMDERTRRIKKFLKPLGIPPIKVNVEE